jgi:TolA-binding protein
MNPRSATTILVAPFVAALFTASASAATDARAADLAVARSALHEGLVLFAVPVLERLVGDQSFAGRDEAMLLLAKCRFRLRRYDEVARLLDGYDELFPKSGEFILPAAHDLARANLERARAAGVRIADRNALLQRARSGFQRVLNESTDQSLLESARFYLGVTLYEERTYELAFETFSRVAVAGAPPDRAQSLRLHIGHCHLMLRRFADALRAYEAFIRDFPRSRLLANSWYGVGEARYYLEQWQQAASAYAHARDAAMARENADMVARARYARGWALAKLGEKRRRAGDKKGANEAWLDGLEEFEELLDSSPGIRRESAMFESGEILYKLGRYNDAADMLLELTDMRVYPTHAAAALYRLGDCRRRLGQWREAAEAYSKALTQAGAKGELERRSRFGYARALVYLGQPQRAREELSPLASPTQSPSIRAAALREMGIVTSRAAKVARDAGDNVAAAQLYARAYKDYDELLRDEEAVAELSTDEIAYWRGWCADNRARLESDNAMRNQWLDLAFTSYRDIRTRSGRGKWTAISLEAEAKLQVFQGNTDAAAKAYYELLSLAILARGQFRDEDDGEDFNRLSVEARLMLGDIELDRRNTEAARTVLAPVIGDESGREEATYKTALSYLLEEDSSEVAEQAFVTFLDRFPDGVWAADAIEGLARALWRQEKYKDAARQFERLIESHPTYHDIDRVRLSAGDTARAAGDAARAVGHYRVLFDGGSSRELRTRAGVRMGEIALSEGNVSLALRSAERALEVQNSGRPANEAHLLRGMALVAARQHADAAAAFARAVDDETRTLAASGAKIGAPDRAFIEFARFHHAGALAAVGRSGTLAQPADTLRRAARAYVEVVQKTPQPFPEKSSVPSLREKAILMGAEVLVELASVEQSDGRRNVALQELDEALQLLKLSGDKARAAVRSRDIERRRKELGQVDGR